MSKTLDHEDYSQTSEEQRQPARTRAHNPPVTGETSDESDRQLCGHGEGRQSVQNKYHGDQLLPTGQRLQQPLPSTTTSHNYYAGPVTQYDLSGASNVTLSVGEQKIKGCLSNETLKDRIQALRDIFVQVNAVEKVKTRLKTYDHVTLCGAPGDGKTSLALMMCEYYQHKNYQTLFVQNIEEFDIDTIRKPDTDILIVFDDIFGTLTFSCDLEKIHKLCTALTDVMQNMTWHRENTRKVNRDGMNEEGVGTSKHKYKLHVMFTSRTYNLNEGCSQLFGFKFNLFRAETILDLTKEGLTSDEKIKIISSYQQWITHTDISQDDIKAITDCQNTIFGFPFICKLYFTTAAFQMHTLNFFQHPLSYLRQDLDRVVREGSNRSAAIILLILSGGTFDLVSFEMNRDTHLINSSMNEICPNVTRTDIRREIFNFKGTYCSVEQQIASFSHPSIYDAAVCALGKLNIILLLKYCSLKFMFERVRVNKNKHCHSPEPDDVTNMIYIGESLYPLVVSRLVEGIRQGQFSMTVNHPILGYDDVVYKVLADLREILPDLVQEKDNDTKTCFMHWVSVSESHVMFDAALDAVRGVLQMQYMTESRSLFQRIVNNIRRTLGGKPDPQTVSKNTKANVINHLHYILGSCVQHAKLEFLQQVIDVLRQNCNFNINFHGEENKTLLMRASENDHPNVFNYLLEEKANVTFTDIYNRNCLHYACMSGSRNIAKRILDNVPKMIDEPDINGTTPALMCAKRGHVQLLKFLVSRGTNLSIKDDMDRNGLHLACYEGHLSVVKYVLTLKTSNLDINQTDFSLLTPVMLAAKSGHLDIYNLLVSEGADLSLTDEDNHDCLMLACRGGNMSIVKHLLSLKTFDINQRGGYCDQTPVMMAAESGHLDIYNLLVSEGADLSLTDKYNTDCLMLVCRGGNMSIVKHFLSLKTFDINQRGGSLDQTPVMMAAESGHLDIYNLLVSEGADLSLTDKYNTDCLMLACWGGNMSVVTHLLSLKTFDINKRGGYCDQTPVMMAAKSGHLDMYNLLVSEGADLSLTDKYNTDCLMLACKKGNMSIVKHLLSLKTFDINKRGGYCDQTPVMMAAESGHLDIYNLLVSEGADLSLTDKYNTDCLMLACKKGNMSIVKHLLSLKTFDINKRRGSLDQTPVMMAAESGHLDIYNLLVSEGADLSLTDKYNTDCLMLTCWGGNMSIVTHLLSLKTFDINKRGGYCDQTPVMMAAESGHLDIYNLLVSEGADLSLTDKYNTDCLMLACKEGNMSIVKHLLSLKTFDINKRGGYCDRTPVMMAAESSHLDIYNLLVSEGADLSLTDKYNTDCLMLACWGGNMSIVTHLLSLKTFDINKRGGSLDQTPVMMAAESGHLDIYNLLVSEGADLSLTDKYNRDCLMLACKRHNMAIVKHLSLKTFDINKRGGLLD